jgi:hypothetical protein
MCGASGPDTATTAPTQTAGAIHGLKLAPKVLREQADFMLAPRRKNANPQPPPARELPALCVSLRSVVSVSTMEEPRHAFGTLPFGSRAEAEPGNILEAEAELHSKTRPPEYAGRAGALLRLRFSRAPYAPPVNWRFGVGVECLACGGPGCA